MTRFLRVRALGHDVRVAVRPGTAPGPPLVLCNGIGASLDLLQPFVDEVDPRIEVVSSTGTGMLMVPASLSVLSKMLTPRRYRDPAYAQAIAPELYGGLMRRRPDQVRPVTYERERLGSTAGYVLQLLAGVGWTSLPALPLIRQPTLLLAGNDDPLIPLVNARIMRTLLPNAMLHVYGDGHLGLLTSADELGPLVSLFLTSQRADGASTSS